MEEIGIEVPPEDEVVELPDDTDMTQEEFRASAAQGTPVRIVASREEFVVAIPVSDEELHYRACDDCGQSHPAWISCENEVLSTAADEPPPR